MYPPTLKQIRYLCAVASHMHFGKAAQSCFVSQSTLSAAILELEENLGVKLLERNNKRVQVTAIGREIVERGQGVLAAMDDLSSAAQAAREPFSTEMHLGVIPTIAPFLLPQVLKKTRKRYPNFKLFIREGLSDSLLKDLLSGQLDLLLLALPYPAEGVDVAHLFFDEFYLAYHSGDAIQELAEVRVKALRGKDLLLLEDGHCLRDHALGACKIQTDQVNMPYQATSLMTIVQMIANGIGISILPKMAVDAGILRGSSVKARRFDEQGVQRSIGLMWRKGSPRQEEFEALGTLICNTLKM